MFFFSRARAGERGRERKAKQINAHFFPLSIQHQIKSSITGRGRGQGQGGEAGAEAVLLVLRDETMRKEERRARKRKERKKKLTTILFPLSVPFNRPLFNHNTGAHQEGQGRGRGRGPEGAESPQGARRSKKIRNGEERELFSFFAKGKKIAQRKKNRFMLTRFSFFSSSFSPP